MLLCLVIPSYSDDLYIWESCKNVCKVQQAWLVWSVNKLVLVKENKTCILKIITFKLLKKKKTSRQVLRKIQENKKTEHIFILLESM